VIFGRFVILKYQKSLLCWLVSVWRHHTIHSPHPYCDLGEQGGERWSIEGPCFVSGSSRHQEIWVRDINTFVEVSGGVAFRSREEGMFGVGGGSWHSKAMTSFS